MALETPEYSNVYQTLLLISVAISLLIVVLNTGTRECKELDINVKCDHRANRQTRQVSTPPAVPAEDTYVLDAIIPVEE